MDQPDRENANDETEERASARYLHGFPERAFNERIAGKAGRGNGPVFALHRDVHHHVLARHFTKHGEQFCTEALACNLELCGEHHELRRDDRPGSG